MISIFIIIVCLQISTIHGDCNYDNYIAGRSLVLHRIRDDYLFSTKQQNSIIPEDGSVELFCGSGFNNDYNSRKAGKMMTVYCDNDETYYKIDGYNKFSLSNYRQFTCPSFSPSFYAQKFNYCEYEGFFYGIEINDIPIVLAEFCYNYNNSEIISVHYVAGKRNALLSVQSEYNPSENYEYSLDNTSKISPLYEEYPPWIEFEKNFTLFYPSVRLLLMEIHYEFHELVPAHLYSGHLYDFTKNMKSTNAITWWLPLKKGNWGIFHELLVKEISKRSFEIYAGQSGVATYPEDFVCNFNNDLIYEFNHEQKNIPLYIWNYIIPRHNDDEEFVLIAINSPFTENIASNSFVLCDDICDQIDWLRPLESTRRIAGFGYIFCCKPDDVKNKLNGFPKL